MGAAGVIGEEDALLRELYPRAPWQIILRVLGSRSKNWAIKRACRLGVARVEREYSEETLAKYSARAKTGSIRRGKFLRPVVICDGIEGKICSGQCGEWRPIAKFARHPDCAGGRRSICSTCDGRYQLANFPERRRADARRWRDNNREKHRIMKRVCNRRRHGRIMNGPGVRMHEWRAILIAHKGACAYCGGPPESLDHVIPLCRGGLHSPTNVVPACKRCNFEKRTMTGEEFRQKRGQ